MRPIHRNRATNLHDGSKHSSSFSKIDRCIIPYNLFNREKNEDKKNNELRIRAQQFRVIKTHRNIKRYECQKAHLYLYVFVQSIRDRTKLRNRREGGEWGEGKEKKAKSYWNVHPFKFKTKDEYKA